MSHVDNFRRNAIRAPIESPENQLSNGTRIAFALSTGSENPAEFVRAFADNKYKNACRIVDLYNIGQQNLIYPIITKMVFRIRNYRAHFSDPMRTKSIIFVRCQFWRRSKTKIQGFRLASKLFPYQNHR